jgi:hypothetical protein
VLAFLTMFVTLWSSTTPGPLIVARSTAFVDERIANVLGASDWLKRHTEPR